MKILGGIIFFLVILILTSLGGLWIGAKVFAQWQKIPSEFISVTMLWNYYEIYKDNAAVMKPLRICFGVAAACPVFTTILMGVALLAKPKRSLHGDAKFASKMEIRKAGLIQPKNKKQKYPSVLIGKNGKDYLFFSGQQFVYVAAPTRSGKGVGIVIPNLLTYPDSVVVLDIKLENWQMTAGFRAKHGQQCFLFAPDSPDQLSHRWNPLSYIRREEMFRVGDTLNIANIIFPSGGQDAFWNEAAQTLFLGLVLYMLDTPEQPCTLNQLIKLTSPMGSDLAKWIKTTVEERLTDKKPLSSECVQALLSFASNSDNTRASILSTLSAPLNIFRDPITAAATSGDDFDLRDVRKKRMSIYIGILPNNIAKFGRLINLFFSQLINENTSQLPQDNPDLKYQCLLLMDEFTAMGRVGIIEKSVAYMAGYNMRLLLIFQSQSQLEGNNLYGKEGTQTMLSNMACQIIFPPRVTKDANDYSEMLGYETIKSKSRTNSFGGKNSENISDQRRALLLPQELKEMDQSKEIISLENTKPILANKIKWYEDELLSVRANFPMPEVPKLIIQTSQSLRSVTLSEANTISIDQIANRAEILEAANQLIGFESNEIKGVI
jgi:type IV secretion system protein VirD4